MTSVNPWKLEPPTPSLQRVPTLDSWCLSQELCLIYLTQGCHGLIQRNRHIRPLPHIVTFTSNRIFQHISLRFVREDRAFSHFDGVRRPVWMNWTCFHLTGSNVESSSHLRIVKFPEFLGPCDLHQERSLLHEHRPLKSSSVDSDHDRRCRGCFHLLANR